MSNETKIIVGIAIVTIALLGGGIFFLSKNSNTNSQQSSSTPANPKLLIRSDSHEIVATPSAKVTLVEFGDYQCPVCGEAYPVVKQILSTYNGKINFVFRNFPLPQHQNAKIAAEAAEAAGAQGKYWQMHDMLYEHQNDWSGSSDPLKMFDTYAKQLNLNITQFNNDVNGNKYASNIQQGIDDGNSLGVNATPTFYINGIQYVGYQTYQQMKTAIDSAISKEK